MAKKVTKKASKKKAPAQTRASHQPRASSAAADPVAVRRDEDAGKIWSHLRQKWLVETPEEAVRQSYLPVLVNEYGYSVEQIGEEMNVTGRGTANARADFVIWRTAQDRRDASAPLIVVECKSDNVTIKAEDYGQGDAYARIVDARFVVTHNSRETRYWRVRKDKMPGYLEEIENIPHAEDSDAEIDRLLNSLRVFKEDEFAKLLGKCHQEIWTRDHKSPEQAFDEMAKVLFVKVWVEREMRRKRQRQNLFTVEWLNSQLGDNPLQTLFEQTKQAFADDGIFDDRDRIELRPDTGREVVRLLEKYNLSDTSEDIKGIAFEKFLSDTFRGDLGQYFTPRAVVEFMIRMVEPKEGEVICDPASGSGGFLIRFFEIVREQILESEDRAYADLAEALQKKRLSAERRAEQLRAKDEARQRALDPAIEESRTWHLANRCIYGCDANDRMARTSKMNMIMHGDGHGGVHHHNGFINVNGIFEGRFDIILTNPPFGATVAPTDRITEGDLRTTEEQRRRYTRAYGDAYKEAQDRVKAALARRAPIGSLFDLPYRGEEDESKRAKHKLGKIKTEVLFIERCLALLKPGGRLGIVLPEGVFNNPSLQYVREFCEDRARILAVVSLPQDVFNAAGATVKASLLFVQKFTEEEAARYSEIRRAATAEIDAKYADEIATETESLNAEIAEAKQARDADRRKAAQAQLKAYEKRMADLKTAEARALLRERFDYPIFFYDAAHVGITATGEPDTCELYNDRMLGLPTGVSEADTALELYARFREDAESFMLDREPTGAPS